MLPALLGSKAVEPEIEVEVVFNQQQGNEEIQQIKEISQGEGSSSEDLPFYWGIGITSSYQNGMAVVEYVASGYCAEANGIKQYDLIAKLNGLPLGDNNDIKGEGPKKLDLTILRNGSIIKISMERCKVYY